MKKSKLFSVALLLMVALSALLMASCGNNDNPQVTPPKDLSYDKTGGTLVQESGIDEGDIVKTYGNLAYKFQSDGLVIYKLTNGEAIKKAYYKFPGSSLRRGYIRKRAYAILRFRTPVTLITPRTPTT